MPLIDSDDTSMDQTRAEEDTVLVRYTVIKHLWRLSQFSLISKFLVNHLKDKTSSITVNEFSLIWRSITLCQHFTTCLLIHTWTCTSLPDFFSISVVLSARHVTLKVTLLSTWSGGLSAVCVAIISHGLFSQIIYSPRNSNSKFSWHFRGSADKKASKMFCSENAKRMNHIPAQWTCLLA